MCLTQGELEYDSLRMKECEVYWNKVKPQKLANAPFELWQDLRSRTCICGYHK